jgi:hypothetical protein
MGTKPEAKTPLIRNNSLVDPWSMVHFLSGIFLGLIFNPVFAFILMVLWEPLEILILSPLLGKKGIVFGHETLRNSISDIVFNSAGILLAALMIARAS